MSERRHLIEARAPARVSIKSRNYASVFFSACLVTRRSILERSFVVLEKFLRAKPTTAFYL